MIAVLIIEDLFTLGESNKSLSLATMIRGQLAANVDSVWLYDGLTCSEVQQDAELASPAFAKSPRASAAVFAKWAARRFSEVSSLYLIVDLHFGRDENYGYNVFVQLSSQARDVKIEPIVYSRFVTDDNRVTLANKFRTSAERILQRDTDSNAGLITLLKGLL